MIRSSSKSLSSSRLAVLAVGTFVLGVDGLVLAGLLPAVAQDLHVSLAQAGQLTTTFALTYAISSPLIATATGRLDRRVVLGGGMVVFLLGMVGQALGPTYAVVLAGRILAALGAAGFQANAYAVVGFLSAPERRARSLAVVGAGSSLATVIGVPIGALVGQHLGWRAALWLITGGAVVAAALCLALPGVRLPVASLRERIRILGTPSVLLLLCGTALQLVPQFAVISYIAPIIGAQGQTATSAVVALVVFGVAFFTGNRLVGHLADRWGALRVITVGLTVSALALVALWIVRLSLVPAIAALAVLGLVASFQVTPQQTRVFAAGGAAATVALGLNGSMIYVGSGGGAALGGGVITVAGVGFVPLVAAGMALVALAFLWAFAPERRQVLDHRVDTVRR
ncbi:MFS transporter [Amycolatopsis sp. DG1A-15b]|uniref:MFS transporter n=1 Tax=Amycolatopsis sp. DG1A-15b TaxID=3052846 RepID=UPI00255B8DF3|nr:MFS transporter [Amycolatopsis sp. DG1A-15b]WIX88222.1 MFS transporter [Amycolatopsis sp. DG1A-15b]